MVDVEVLVDGASANCAFAILLGIRAVVVVHSDAILPLNLAPSPVTSMFIIAAKFVFAHPRHTEVAAASVFIRDHPTVKTCKSLRHQIIFLLIA